MATRRKPLEKYGIKPFAGGKCSRFSFIRRSAGVILLGMTAILFADFALKRQTGFSLYLQYINKQFALFSDQGYVYVQYYDTDPGQLSRCCILSSTVLPVAVAPAPPWSNSFCGCGIVSGVMVGLVPGALDYQTNGLQIQIPAFYIASLLGLIGVLLSWFGPKRAFEQGLCAKCGYDLRASKYRCPECGTPIPVDKARGGSPRTSADSGGSSSTVSGGP
jgi:hypothetical protein